MMDRRLLEAKRRDQNVVREAVEEALTNGGLAHVSGLEPPDELERIHYEAERLPMFMRRRVGDWNETYRAAFIPLGALTLRRPHLVAVGAELWLPNAAACVNGLASHVRAAGHTLDIEPLANWKPNRVGLNYMRGTSDNPAEIAPHTDPVAETGLVASLQLTGHGEVNGRPSDRGELYLFLGADVCGLAGIEQPMHSIISDGYRISLTAAQLSAGSD